MNINSQSKIVKLNNAETLTPAQCRAQEPAQHRGQKPAQAQDQTKNQTQEQAEDKGLRSLARALDALVADETSFLYLSLPAHTMKEIQENFTINAWPRRGIADNAGNKPY